MPGPPAFCMNCNIIFEVAAFGFNGPGAATIHLSSNLATCPQCGGFAKVGDGTYTYQHGQMNLKSGPPFTRAMVDAIAAIAQRAKRDSLSTEEIIREVAGVSPELADKLKSRLSLPSVVLILILFWIVKGVSLNISLDANRLWDQATELFNRNPDMEIGPDTPLPPIHLTKAEQRAPTRLADRSANPPNRKARRRAAAQSRRATKRRS